MQTITIILGPTSSGKTSLALELTKQTGGEILSADSRQIYKHMDIGTGKIPLNSNIKYTKSGKKWVLDGINVWGYDLTTPEKYFSASDYLDFALSKAKEVVTDKKRLFVAGGTGFYIDLLTGKAKTAGIKPDFELRTELEKLDSPTLHQMLMSLNSEKASQIDAQNPARLIRAIEIEKSFNYTFTPLPILKKVNFIGLTAEREVLYSRADNWVDEVWKNGLVEETQQLFGMGYEDTLPLRGVIYKGVTEFIKGNLTKEEAIQKNKFSLHAYIRRQQTWFKKNKDIKWFNITTPDLVSTLLKELKTG
jgi:tRNA dimethylallyltransferase